MRILNYLTTIRFIKGRGYIRTYKWLRTQKKKLKNVRFSGKINELTKVRTYITEMSVGRLIR